MKNYQVYNYSIFEPDNDNFTNALHWWNLYLLVYKTTNSVDFSGSRDASKLKYVKINLLAMLY